MSSPRSPSGVRSMTVAIVYWPMSESYPSLRAGRADVVKRLDDAIDHPVLLRLLGREPAVAVTVPGNRLFALPGVLGGDPLDGLLHELEVLGLDRDIGGRSADACRRLMHEDPGVRQRAAFPPR